MDYYKNTTQTPNELFDVLLKTLTTSELKVLLTIIRKTIGMIDPSSGKRVERAWISQRLFMRCCSLSGRAVSTAIESLVHQHLIEVTDKEGRELNAKYKRRGVSRLYFASRLRLVQNLKKASEPAGINPVTKGHTIKLTTIKLSCYKRSQGIRKLSDEERYQQILSEQTAQTSRNTPRSKPS